jgi:tripartite-type tricarboxylate transporter receptor subunit TctC
LDSKITSLKERRADMEKKRYLITVMFLTLLVTSFFIAGTAFSQDYPKRTIQYIVGWGAGGGSDIFGRVITVPVKNKLGVPVIVVNMPGASSATATNYVMDQPADGYTLFGTTSDIMSNIFLARTKYTNRDLTPIIRAHVDIGMIQIGPHTPFKTWDALIKHAKENPGKQTWGGTGAGSYDEVASAVIRSSAGINVKYVPFESASEMHAALLGGHIHAMYEEAGPVIAMIDAGKTQPVIVIADKRLERFPNVPCAKELGYSVPPFQWRGVAVKKGTPQPIVDILEKAFIEAVKSPEYQDFEKKRFLNLYPGFLGSKDSAVDMEREYPIYEEIMKKMGQATK